MNELESEKNRRRIGMNEVGARVSRLTHCPF